MLDFSKLITPARHGEVLVLPSPAECVSAVQSNARALRIAKTPLLNSTLGEWRRRTRERVVGSDEGPIIVTGHQPAFIHPGVWAKHVVSMRLADAFGGIALNLVVDNDAPQAMTFPVPAVENSSVVLRSVRYADLRSGLAYEQLRGLTPEDITQFEAAIRQAMGDRYDASQMPTFVRGLSTGDPLRDGTDQSVIARRAVEADFDIAVDDWRVSRVWWSPLLLDMLGRAERFSHSYNAALEWYRKEFRVRGRQRPIPDLAARSGDWELPVWAYRSGEARRRLFVSRASGRLRLFADREEIGVLADDDFSTVDELISPLRGPDAWRLRPRAMTLTIWARLFLADLFIHGIGGAKYDRISNAIIADYFGIEPPEMACVSATLHLDLPRTLTTPETIRGLRRSLRDLEWNPQRDLSQDPEMASLADQRERAVRQSADLRNANPGDRNARRTAFWEIRELNRRLGALRSGEASNKQRELDRALEDLNQNRIALGREYFFGLYGRAALEGLLAALPATKDFRV